MLNFTIGSGRSLLLGAFNILNISVWCCVVGICNTNNDGNDFNYIVMINSNCKIQTNPNENAHGEEGVYVIN